jgi:cation diffusion facilitator family transporter
VDATRKKLNVAGLSVISNSLLVVMKLIVGLIIGSTSIMSEAIHSGVDLLAALIAFFSVRTSSIPADTDHPFGHGKVENISGTVEALLIFVAAGWIIYEAARKLLNPLPLENAGWGVGVMAVSVITNIWVSGLLFKVGRETDSIALQADAWHLRTDVYTSAGVMASLAVIWGAHFFFTDPKVHWIDPAAAIAVALMIISAAYRLTLQSARDLVDSRLPENEETWIGTLIAGYQPTIRGFHQLRTRKSGNFRFVDFHIKVGPAMSVDDSHRITDELTNSIRSRFPKTSVTIHTEPCNGGCVPKCLHGCLLTETQREELVEKEVSSTQ